MFSRTEERIGAFFIALGFLIRAILLHVRGQDFEVDQAVILYWGRAFWQEAHPAVFGPEFTHWEMLTSYLFGGLDLLGLNSQWGAFVLSGLEIGLLGLWVRSKWGRSEAIVAMAVLAVLPWHVYYSSIVGTCVAVGIWPFLLLRGGLPFFLGCALRAIGLWHYSAFRVFLAAEFLWSLVVRRRNAVGGRRVVVQSIVGFSIFLGAVLAWQPDLWRNAFFRGEYVFQTPEYAWWQAVPRGIVFLFTPMFATQTRIADMEVGSAFIDFLGPYGLPLSFLGTLFFLIGLITTLRARRGGWGFVLFYVAFSILTVSYAASFTHLLFLVPMLALLIAVGSGTVPPRYRKVVLLLLLGEMAGASGSMISHFARPRPRDYFSHRIVEEVKILEAADPRAPGQRKYLYSPQGLVEGRYWMAKNKTFTVLAPTGDTHGTELQMRLGGGKAEPQWILMDRFVDPALDPEKFPGIAAQNRSALEMIDHLKRYAQILEERTIDEGVVRATLFKIRWP